MSEENQERPEIFSPNQPAASNVPFLSQEPTEPGFAAPVAPTAPPVAPSHIDVSKRRTLFELWGDTFRTLRANFSPVVQISALLAFITTAIQVVMLFSIFTLVPGVTGLLADIQSGDTMAIETEDLADLGIGTITNDQIVGLVATIGISVVALFLMTFVGTGIYWIFVAPRADGAEPISFREVRRDFLRTLPRMLSATLMWGLRSLLIITVMLVAVIATELVSDNLSWLLAIIFGAGAGFLVWYAIGVTLTSFVVQSTSLSGNKSVSRSVELVRGAWWRTLWVLIATNIVFGMFASAISGLVPMPTSALDTGDAMPWAYLALFGSSTFISALVSLPLTGIALAHYYRDRSGS